MLDDRRLIAGFKLQFGFCVQFACVQCLPWVLQLPPTDQNQLQSD